MKLNCCRYSANIQKVTVNPKKKIVRLSFPSFALLVRLSFVVFSKLKRLSEKYTPNESPWCRISNYEMKLKNYTWPYVELGPNWNYMPLCFEDPNTWGFTVDMIFNVIYKQISLGTKYLPF